MFPVLVALVAAVALAADAPSAAPPRPAAALPAGELGQTIALGKRLFEQTGKDPLTSPYVRNDLSCDSCHPDAGAHPAAATLLGAATAYPAWSPREKAVITLEDRVLNCFMRSMHGVRPPNGSKPAVAITAYLTWLSTGEPVRQNPGAPLGPRSYRKLPADPAKVDVASGERTYARRCASCHGADGQGAPPVWGPRSYNAGAGLAELPKLAGWLAVAMPPAGPPLAEAEAIDVAAFVNSHPRPDFVLREHLPQGGVYNATVLDEVVRAPTWPPAGKR